MRNNTCCKRLIEIVNNVYCQAVKGSVLNLLEEVCGPGVRILLGTEPDNDASVKISAACFDCVKRAGSGSSSDTSGPMCAFTSPEMDVASSGARLSAVVFIRSSWTCSPAEVRRGRNAEIPECHLCSLQPSCAPLCGKGRSSRQRLAGLGTPLSLLLSSSSRRIVHRLPLRNFMTEPKRSCWLSLAAAQRRDGEFGELRLISRVV
ncbi:hypothetical protein FQN60_007187 [Etheostoma spectabile]|uniref:Uncharacterized protein n=1 Tax=Etheostoma spectabile TaxID=54343 RepID=A0A5J5CF74_9PERO|nr:hypothetical protein FQN60_007187 [Etheostoma spectabile]